MIAEVSRTNPNRRLKRTSRRDPKNKQREAGRRESSESGYTYIGAGGTKVCIESRNANASNIDTASPFERSLNLSRHSSHPFSYSSSANPNTAPRVRAHATRRAYFPGVLERKDTRARRGRVGGVEGPPINRMCGL